MTTYDRFRKVTKMVDNHMTDTSNIKIVNFHILSYESIWNESDFEILS